MPPFPLRLNDHETKVLRFLAERFDQGQKVVLLDDLPDHDLLGAYQLVLTAARFINYDLVQWHTEPLGLTKERKLGVSISRNVLDAVHNIDHPPPRDYWNDVTIWFKGQWWSVPLVAIVVLAPVLAQWIQWTLGLIHWAFPQGGPPVN